MLSPQEQFIINMKYKSFILQKNKMETFHENTSHASPATNAITVSPGYEGRNRPVRKSDYEPLPLRWKVVLDYRLAGVKVPEICKRTGYSPSFVYRILNDERALQAKQFLLAQTQEEFSTLFEKVVDVVKDALEDPEKRLEAAALWLKANGKMSKDSSSVTVQVTAEDVVMQILNGTL